MAFHLLTTFLKLLGIFATVSLLFAVYTHRNTSKSVWQNDVSYNRISLEESTSILGDFQHFKFLINRDICGTENVHMLIVIGSHPQHRSLRNVLRKTVGQPMIDGKIIKVVFGFGYLTNFTEQLLLEAESEMHKDVIQGNFIDSYRNVTLRDLMSLRWAWKFCPQARLIMRLDDDTSVDIYTMFGIAEKYYKALKKTVGCFRVWYGAPVMRTDTYAVSKDEHPDDIYEPYCAGWMYLLTPKLAYKLDMASRISKPYWMNDAYITGTLIKMIGKEPLNLELSFAILSSDLIESLNSWPPTFVVGNTDANETLTLLLHNMYKKYYLTKNNSTS
ncbi:hypothetical protein CHUAL_006910 [Chamberlinius hualienensis]